MIHYRPAVVKKPKSGKWYIEFYQTNPLTGKMDRFRQTPQLNRIKDLRLRAKYAHEIEAEINLRLPRGYPFDDDFDVRRTYMPLMEAIGIAVKIKVQNTDRAKTIEHYESAGRIFIGWIEKAGLTRLKLSAMNKKIR